MSETEATYQLIEQYLAGKLEGEALASFEARLASDPKLRSTLALVGEVDAVLDDRDTMAFSQTVAEADKAYFVSTDGHREETAHAIRQKRAVRRFPVWMAVAASVILLAVVGYFTLSGGSRTPSEIFDEHFSSYEVPGTFRGGVDTAKGADSLKMAQYGQAFDVYTAGAFKEAIPLLEEIKASYPEERMASFYLGLSHLELGQAKEAIPSLEKAGRGSYTPFGRQARWYLGLAYLKNGDLDSARTSFHEFEYKGGGYQKAAQEIVKELEKLLSDK